MRHLAAAFALCTGLAATATAQEPAKDALGDPLPPGAVARLGTERMRTIDGYTATRFHPDGKALIGSVQGVSTLIDPSTGKPLGPFGKSSVRQAATVSADGKRAAASTFDGVVVWDVETGKTVYSPKTPRGIEGVTLSADGKTLAVGVRPEQKEGDKGKEKETASLLLFDVDGQKDLGSLKVLQNQNAKVALSADGKRAVTWGNHYEQTKPGEEVDPEKNPGRVVQLWDVVAKKELGRGRLPLGFVVAAAITPAGDLAAAASGDGSVVLFDGATGKPGKELLGTARVGSTLAFAPDGKQLAAAASDGCVQVWEVPAGKPLGTCGSPSAGDYIPSISLAFSGPGRVLACGAVGATTLVWEAPSGKILSPVGGHKHPPTALAFSADDKQVISVASYGEAVRWDTAGKRQGDQPLTLPGGSPAPRASGSVFIPPGGKVLLRTGGGNGLEVFSLPDGALKFSLSVPFGADPQVAATADGKRLVVATNLGYGAKAKSGLAVIDLADGAKVNDFPLGAGQVGAVCLTPDGTKAALLRTVSDEKGNSKWVFGGFDLAAGKPLAEAELKGSFFGRPRLAAVDNKTVLGTSPESGSLALFDLATGKADKFADGKQAGGVGPVFSPDGKRVAFAAESYGGTTPVQVFDVAAGKRTHQLKGHIRPVTAIAFSNDGNTLATGSGDTTVLLWDLSKEK